MLVCKVLCRRKFIIWYNGIWFCEV